jgi:Flp pilus assembly protein TadB
MLEAAALLFAVLGLALVGYSWQNLSARRRARQRLGQAPESGSATSAGKTRPASAARRFPPRYRLLPWLAAGLAALTLFFLTGCGSILAGALGLVLGLLSAQLEGWLAARRTARIEAQLSDAIDLMVGGLRGGAGVMGALENAVSESRSPLRPQLDELLGRIRYGDDPQVVLRALVQRVPLETFQLFTSALSVHWEVGGSLAPTLANVGRTIRDRIEIARRVQALTAQARASIAAVLGVTYFLALMVWRSDPARMVDFLSTTVGRGLVSGAVVLQAVGIVWSAALSRLRY